MGTFFGGFWRSILCERAMYIYFRFRLPCVNGYDSPGSFLHRSRRRGFLNETIPRDTPMIIGELHRSLELKTVLGAYGPSSDFIGRRRPKESTRYYKYSPRFLILIAYKSMYYHLSRTHEICSQKYGETVHWYYPKHLSSRSSKADGLDGIPIRALWSHDDASIERRVPKSQ